MVTFGALERGTSPPSLVSAWYKYDPLTVLEFDKVHRIFSCAGIFWISTLSPLSTTMVSLYLMDRCLLALGIGNISRYDAHENRENRSIRDEIPLYHDYRCLRGRCTGRISYDMLLLLPLHSSAQE